jgi:tRNA (guanine-N7-)-methyltransferase
MPAGGKNFNWKGLEMGVVLRVDGEIPPENREEAERYFHGLFGNSNPLVVELGSGNGHFLVEWAVRHPDRNYVGTEILSGRTEKFKAKVEKRNLPNLLIFRGEIRRFVWEFLHERTVHEFVSLFPDPWPKKRHHKHRLISGPFVGMLERRLVPGGSVSIATDSADYREWILEVFAANTGFRNLFGVGYAPYPADYPDTLFLRRFRDQRKEVFFMRFGKGAGPTAAP